jgi:uncharacterized protein (TIGR03083 family)
MPPAPSNDAETDWMERGRQATEALEQTWGSLAEVCHALVSQEWALPTECPGWDVKDQLSHLIGIERLLLGETAPRWDGPMGDHVKNDFAAMNEPWIAVRRHLPGDEVLAEFKEVTAARLAALRAMTPEEWATVGWSPVGEVPYARFMETRVFDSWVHEQDVRHALDRPGGTGNIASDWGIGQVQGALGMIVGKRVSPPEGTVVRFDLDGDGGDARTITIAVEDGRAKLVPMSQTVHPEPTVRIGLSSIDFVRLGCGRASAAAIAAAGGVEVEGDADLGQRVLQNMNFMF